MIKLFSVALFLLISLLGFSGFSELKTGHPYHVGITQMDYISKDSSIEIGSKLAYEDMEKWLQLRYNTLTSLEDLIVEDSIKSTIQNYFSQRFKVFVQDKEQVISFVGHEISDHDVWLYHTIKNVHIDKSFEVYNSIFTDLSDEQVNLVHFSINNEILQSESFNSGVQKKAFFLPSRK